LTLVDPPRQRVTRPETWPDLGISVYTIKREKDVEAWSTVP
jgi:hypothetical protein